MVIISCFSLQRGDNDNTEKRNTEQQDAMIHHKHCELIFRTNSKFGCSFVFFWFVLNYNL